MTFSLLNEMVAKRAEEFLMSEPIRQDLRDDERMMGREEGTPDHSRHSIGL